MLIRVHPAPMFATNCWVLATGQGSECIIVDPGGPDVSPDIEAIVAHENLKPVAILLTHGHLVFSRAVGRWIFNSRLYP